MNSSDLDPFLVLGVLPSASDEEIAAAYHAGIKRSPPDRDPEGFKRVRAAYEALRNEEQRLRFRLFGPEPLSAIGDLVDLIPDDNKFIGPVPWLELLKEVRG